MLLDIENLHVHLSNGTVHAVRGVDLSVKKGETICLVGESGSGKSTTALSIMGLLPRGASRSADRLSFQGADLGPMSGVHEKRLRGDRMAIIFQDPMTSLNPAYTVGNQLCEVYYRHRGRKPAEARERALFLLGRVGISNPSARLRQYPHQLSGGLRQRVMIAMALMCGPDLLIADEPTSALDVTIQIQILRLLQDLQKEFDMGLLLITHDLGVVARVADRVAVMYAGQIVEMGDTKSIFTAPQHPYTRALLRSVPALGVGRGAPLFAINGTVPSLAGTFKGCAFRNRCDFATNACGEGDLPVFETVSGTLYRCIHPVSPGMWLKEEAL